MKRFVLGTTLPLLLPFFAFAAGIEVSPEKLEFDLDGTRQSAKEIIIANPTKDVQLFEVSADSHEQAIIINPASFTLEAGERKIVTITLKPGKLQATVIGTSLSIMARPFAESQLQINTGVKIPITIRAARKKYQNFILPLATILIVISALGGYRLYKRKTQKV
jgi:hypothetical protein